MTQRARKAAAQWQRDYYTATAGAYDRMHAADPEHQWALAWLNAIIKQLAVRSVADIGSGTGRVPRSLQDDHQGLTVLAMEPVVPLLQAGVAAGLAANAAVAADAMRLPLATDSVDLVCSFGLLHHVATPTRVVDEMLRVSRKAIFISDSNNFGQGSLLSRTVKQLINSVGLWPAFNLMKTKGKGYLITEGDGLSYSYSVFNNYDQIAAACSGVHVMNTVAAGRNPYRSAGHVALLGVR